MFDREQSYQGMRYIDVEVHVLIHRDVLQIKTI